MLALLAAAAAASQPQGPRHFGDWIVGCDNVRSCHAVGFQLEGEEEFYGLSINRSGDPEAAPRISTELEGIAAAVSDKARLPLRFDGEMNLDARDARPFLDLLLSAQTLTFVDATGKSLGRISPKGASAALRWMDDRQERDGTVTAIVASGSKPAAAVPPPPALPTLRTAQKSAKPPVTLGERQLAEAREDYGCDDRDWMKSEFHRLDSTTTLALIPCLMGAYQGSSVALLLSEKGQRRVPEFERPWEDAANGPISPDVDRNMLVSAEFDPDKLTIWSMYKGRGLNDCGGSEAWAWDGRRFRLAYQNLMDLCRGSRDRITLWRTTNAASEE